MDWEHAAEEHKYDDIRMLVHHRSRMHPPMSLWDRAAQFSPFAALSGHEDAIRETARLTTAKKAGGAYVTVSGVVKKIDEYEKMLWMEDGTVIAIEELSAVEIPGMNRYEEE